MRLLQGFNVDIGKVPRTVSSPQCPISISYYFVPESTLSNSHPISPHNHPWNRYCYYSHFADEEINIWRVKAPLQLLWLCRKLLQPCDVKEPVFSLRILSLRDSDRTQQGLFVSAPQGLVPPLEDSEAGGWNGLMLAVNWEPSFPSTGASPWGSLWRPPYSMVAGFSGEGSPGKGGRCKLGPLYSPPSEAMQYRSHHTGVTEAVLKSYPGSRGGK